MILYYLGQGWSWANYNKTTLILITYDDSICVINIMGANLFKHAKTLGNMARPPGRPQLF